MTTTYSARSFGNRGRADMKKHPVLVGVVGGIVATLLIGVAVWLTIAYTGVYNVAASDQHFDPVRWTFNTTLRRSVAMRDRTEEHTSKLQSLMHNSYPVFRFKQKT